ncbi:Hypothetical_protein [Hexamita inflata]|uniref:Hypothetical_protein n=1 Tax=Hexamita inflata TaxID=28002 RepID=A0AA86PN71_9EUKA|nr:Hypothetical protein HINF_LOCUS26140 [Hexamita inflata]
MNIQVLAGLLEVLETELTCLFTGLYRQSASGYHLFPYARTHVHQPDKCDFTPDCLYFVQCALSSSLIIALAETCTSTALVCPKHAVLSLSVLTSISGAAGSFCWRRLSSFVRSGMRETLAILITNTFKFLSFHRIINQTFISCKNVQIINQLINQCEQFQTIKIFNYQMGIIVVSSKHENQVNIQYQCVNLT